MFPFPLLPSPPSKINLKISSGEDYRKYFLKVEVAILILEKFGFRTMNITMDKDIHVPPFSSLWKLEPTRKLK